MVSTDRELLLEINGRLERIELRLGSLEGRVSSIETRAGKLEEHMTVLEHNQDITNSRLEMSLWFTGICFGVLALVIAFVGMLAPKFWEHSAKKESKPEPEIDIEAIAERAAQIAIFRIGGLKK